ncbi:MAG TPA: ABC transporter permease subunit [Ktedonobacterales bacterium]|jgi:ABC-2 type transport system permease protein|nr:ABC transporter permease subunit [Ktedonobacterales bacterium]
MLNSFVVFLRKELREGWRTSRLPVIVLIFFAFGLMSPLLAKYTPELLKSLGGSIQIVVPAPQTSDAVDQFIKNVEGNGIFVAILLTMGLVAREKERGTAAFVLTKPVSRTAFLAAKLAGLVVTLGIGIAVAGTASYIYTALLFSSLSVGGFILSSLLVLLALLAYAAITFLASTLVSSSLPAAGIGLAGWLLLALLGALPTIGDYTPGGLLTPARAIALGTTPEHLGQSLLGTCGLIVVTVVLAWLSFRSRELAAVE